MNRNTIIGLLLIFGIFIGWSLWMKPSEEELAKQKREQDSIAAIRYTQDSLRAIQEQQAQAALEEEQQEAESVSEEELVQDTALNWNDYGDFAGAALGEEQYFTVENNISRFIISNKGGRIHYVELKDYVTFDSLPLVLVDSDSTMFGLEFFANNRRIFTNDFYFIPYINGQEATGPQELFDQLQ